MGKERMSSDERVDILSDKGRKVLLKMKKKDLVNCFQDTVIIYRLRFAILESYGIDYKKVLKGVERSDDII